MSGRGVGMDVVRTNVEKIGGKVEIDSRAGKGTTLRLRIPLTLAIIPALIVRSLNQSFALPQGALSELVHVPPEQAATAIEWIDDAPLYRLRGRLLPLVFLDRLLMPGGEYKLAADRDNFIAVLDADGRRFGLVVDSLADPEEIVVKPLSRGAQGYRPLLRRHRSGQRRSGADSRSRLDRHEGRRHHERRGRSARAAEEESEAGAKRWSICWWKRPAGAPRCLWATCCASSSSRSPASSTSATGRCSTSRANCCRSRTRAASWPRPQGNPEAQIVVVVCREGNRHVGIAVSHVLDVAAGGSLFEAGTGLQTGGVTLLKDRVTGVVDLGGVAPLPAAEPANAGVEAERGGRWHEHGRRHHRKEKTEALVEVCSVRWGKTLFGVPISHILEIVGAARPQPVPLAPAFVGGLVHYRGDVLTTVSLRQLLDLPPKEGAQDILVLESPGLFWSAGGLGGRGADRFLGRLRGQPFDPRRAPQRSAGRRLQAQGRAAGDARSGAARSDAPGRAPRRHEPMRRRRSFVRRKTCGH